MIDYVLFMQEYDKLPLTINARGLNLRKIWEHNSKEYIIGYQALGSDNIFEFNIPIKMHENDFRNLIKDMLCEIHKHENQHENSIREIMEKVKTEEKRGVQYIE